MYHTIYMRLPTARARDNEETAQNDAKWHI